MNRYAHLYRGAGLLGKVLGKDRVAVVSVRPAAVAGFAVQIARGASRTQLNDVKAFGPLDAADVDAVFEREVNQLKVEGFVRSGLGELLVAIESKSRRKRALAAQRLGWMRERAAVEPLLALAAKANEDLPVVIDALGEIGDIRALAAAQAAAERKLLSRRRPGFEALRKLTLAEDGGKAAGPYADAKNRALERLPEGVRAALGDAEAIDAALQAVGKKDRGLVLDTLYELGETTSVQRALEAADLGEPHLWRYAKSIWKRAMLRRDYATFALIAHRAERLGRADRGTVATIKSGYDGEQKTLRVFGKPTQRWVARASWRWLRRLARYRSDQYALAAAELLVRYQLTDEQKAKGTAGAYADAHLLMRILWGGGKRYVLNARTMRFAARPGAGKAAPSAREEAYPELWDLTPGAYLVAVGRGQLPVVVAFAMRAIAERHPTLIQLASGRDLAALLGSALPEAIALATTEAQRRIAAARPDWADIEAMLSSEHRAASELGLAWLAATAGVWTRSAALALRFVTAGAPAVRSAALTHLEPVLAELDPAERSSLAGSVLTLLSQGEHAEGDHDVLTQLGVALSADIAARLTVDELVAHMMSPAPGLHAVAASALAAHPQALVGVSLEQIILWGVHEHVVVRQAAQSLIWRMRADLPARTPKDDPSIAALLQWSESTWADARAFSVTELARVPHELLSLDLVLGFCDSNHVDVQELGKRLLTQRLASLDAAQVLKRLAEHPHRNLRGYALALAVQHLPSGFVPLAGLEPFFRAVFLDALPDRAIKHKAIAFLGERGLADANQASVAVRLLDELVRSTTQRDREPALVALTRIRLAHPDVASRVQVRP